MFTLDIKMCFRSSSLCDVIIFLQTISKNNKMMSHLNRKMKVVLLDSRTFVGYFKGVLNFFACLM